MRINDIGSRAGDRNILLQGNKQSNQALSGTRGKTFEDALGDSHQNALKEQIIVLLKEIDKQGEKLSRSLTIAELLRYKRLISGFLNTVVSNIYEVYRYNHFDQNGRHDIHCIVKTIDERLEELTSQILQNEKDRLTVLGYIDEIKGLLMDIML